MLKGKEVISDPRRQYEIAREVHVQLQQHGGINRTTASIAERYHWSRIKETVSDVIRNCTECKELGKTPNNSASSTTGTGASNGVAAGAALGASVHNGVVLSEVQSNNASLQRTSSNSGECLSTSHQSLLSVRPGESRPFLATALNAPSPPSDMQESNQYPPTSIPSSMTSTVNGVDELMHQTPKPDQHAVSTYAITSDLSYADPASMTIMSPSETLHTSSNLTDTHSPMLQDQSHGNSLHTAYHNGHHHHHHHHHHHRHNETSHLSMSDYDQPIDPQIISQPSSHHHDPNHGPFGSFSPTHHHPDADAFQALLRQVNNGHSQAQSQPEASAQTPQPPTDESDRIDGDAVDRDMDMLIRQQDDDDDDVELEVDHVGGMDVDPTGVGRAKSSMQKSSSDRHGYDVG